MKTTCRKRDTSEGAVILFFTNTKTIGTKMSRLQSTTFCVAAKLLKDPFKITQGIDFQTKT